jgi:hypothetical protein
VSPIQQPGSGAFGSAKIDRATAVAGEWGTWRVTFVAGRRGIATGGGIRVQLPDSWHVWYRNSARRVQASDPRAPHHVSASTPPGVDADVRVESESELAFVKPGRQGLDGHWNRYTHVIRVTLRSGALVPGDEVGVTIGDRSAGSPGFAAAFHAEGAQSIGVAVDFDGSDNWTVLVDTPVIEVSPNDAVELAAIAPSILHIGEPGVLRVCLLDQHGNLDRGYVGRVTIRPLLSGVDVPPAVDLTRANGGVMLVPYHASSAGILRFAVSTEALSTLSNPTRCEVEPSARKLYWGDLHCHARRSWDAFGDNPFTYGRSAAGLDFMALTDHVEEWTGGEWNEHRREVESHHDPRRFVTILAYEAGFDRPWGHHNVYFADDDGPVVGADGSTLPELWGRLQPGRMFTIPHHTGVAFSAPGQGPAETDHRPNPDWSVDDPIMRRLIEIYSAHGQCEAYDPEHDLSYENTQFTFSYSQPGPHYAWDAWTAGLRLGVVASSDDHHGQPGRGEYGLTGVWAEDLTREALFTGLLARQTFATTGARMIVDMSLLDRSKDGMRADRGNADTVAFALSVNGTAELERVQLVRGVLSSGDFTVVKEWRMSGELDFQATWIDHAPPGSALYYVRARQTARFRGRVVMAWTTPVWVISHGPRAA